MYARAKKNAVSITFSEEMHYICARNSVYIAQFTNESIHYIVY